VTLVIGAVTGMVTISVISDINVSSDVDEPKLTAFVGAKTLTVGALV
jgi:hypothetical protein